jgi:hypothetical protein
MKYLLLIYGDETGWDTIDSSQQHQIVAETLRHRQELTSRGNYLVAEPLQPTTTATCVRIRNGKRLITDGPFVETKEQLGGFLLIEAKDLDEALDIATQHPAVRWEWGAIEIRPIRELPGLNPD